MKLLRSLIVNVVVSGALLFLFGWWLWTNIGIKITFENPENSILKIIIVFLMLWLVFRIFNSPIKWILKTLSCPVNFLTLWLVSIAINVLVFYMFQYFVNTYSHWIIEVKLWAIWQTLILSFIMAICTSILTKILK